MFKATVKKIMEICKRFAGFALNCSTYVISFARFGEQNRTFFRIKMYLNELRFQRKTTNKIERDLFSLGNKLLKHRQQQIYIKEIKRKYSMKKKFKKVI